MKFKEWLYIENFDTVSDFLLNPLHRNKTFSELMSEFEKSGGTIIGNGKYARVYFHPSWPYVLKTYATDSHYTKFVRFAFQNPHPAFPKFYGKPQNVLPFYRRDRGAVSLYLVRMENLEPLNSELKAWINPRSMLDGIYYVKALKYNEPLTYMASYWPSVKERRKAEKEGVERPSHKEQPRFKNVTDILEKYPKLEKTFLAGLLLMENKVSEGSSPDYHSGNFMMRRNGDIVIIDPFWEGSSPYADFLAQRELFDMDFDYSEPEQDVIGGRFPKKKRIKKVKPYIHNNDIPF
jgi:hypothetical protein